MLVEDKTKGKRVSEILAPTSRKHIRLTINGVNYEADVEARLLLVHLIREVFRLTGTHIGCDTTNCGACTVILNGKSVKSCTLLAIQANQANITTIEGLAKNGELHPIQAGFWEYHGLQCGFCTPGMIMQAYWFLRQNPKPTEDQIRKGVSGNLCRCTGYQNIVKAIQAAADEMAPSSKWS